MHSQDVSDKLHPTVDSEFIELCTSLECIRRRSGRFAADTSACGAVRAIVEQDEIVRPRTSRSAARPVIPAPTMAPFTRSISPAPAAV